MIRQKQIAADLLGTFTCTAGGTAAITTIAVPDNSMLRLEVYLAPVRDTGNNWFKQKSSTEWTRAAAGAVTELGTEDGPVKGGTIGGAFPGDVVGLTLTPGATTLVIAFSGSPSIATAGQWEINYSIHPQAHA
jgi:hypothetical protein